LAAALCGQLHRYEERLNVGSASRWIVILTQNGAEEIIGTSSPTGRQPHQRRPVFLAGLMSDARGTREQGRPPRCPGRHCRTCNLPERGADMRDTHSNLVYIAPSSRSVQRQLERSGRSKSSRALVGTFFPAIGGRIPRSRPTTSAFAIGQAPVNPSRGQLQGVTNLSADIPVLPTLRIDPLPHHARPAIRRPTTFGQATSTARPGLAPISTFSDVLDHQRGRILTKQRHGG